MGDSFGGGRPDVGARVAPLWRNRDYMLLWSGQIISTLGGGISGLAYPLLILALTNSPAQAGIAAALAGIPYLIFSLPAGALIDRWDRKAVMIRCDLGRALSAASIPIAAALGRLTVGQLYVTTVIEGSLFVFFNIAEVACLSRVVDAEQLPSASAQNEGGGIVTTLIGPPIGGALFQIARTTPFLVDALSYGASVLTLSRIRTSFQERRIVARRALRAEIAEGITWLWGQPLIRFMAFLTGGLNGVGAVLGLPLIVIARGQHASPAAIGLIFSIGSVGGIAGSLLAPRIQRRFRFGQVIVVSVWIEALLTPLLALAPSVVVLGLVTSGIFFVSPIYNAVQFSYRLSLIPEELQGRVNSAFRLLAFGFNPLGAALAGLLIARITAPDTILIFGAAGLVLALLTTLNPHVRAVGLPDVQEGAS